MIHSIAGCPSNTHTHSQQPRGTKSCFALGFGRGTVTGIASDLYCLHCMIQYNLYGAGGQKVANVATLGLVGGKGQKKDGGKQAMQHPKVHNYMLLLTLCPVAK